MRESPIACQPLTVSDYDRTPNDEIVTRWSGDDGDGYGCLSVTAHTRGFGGVGQAWIDRDEVLDFADALDQLLRQSTESLPVLSAGVGDDRSFDEHVGVRVSMLGRRGQVQVQVRLVTDHRRDHPPGNRDEALIHLPTTLQRLEQFSAGLRLMLQGSVDEAVVGGERL